MRTLSRHERSLFSRRSASEDLCGSFRDAQARAGIEDHASDACARAARRRRVREFLHEGRARRAVSCARDEGPGRLASQDVVRAARAVPGGQREAGGSAHRRGAQERASRGALLRDAQASDGRDPLRRGVLLFDEAEGLRGAARRHRAAASQSDRDQRGVFACRVLQDGWAGDERREPASEGERGEGVGGAPEGASREVSFARVDCAAHQARGAL